MTSQPQSWARPRNRLTPSRWTRRHYGMVRAKAALLCLALLIAPSTHAQSVRGLFASNSQQQGEQGGAGAPRKDWRNTLDWQAPAGKGRQEPRRMSEEERSNLRQHLREAARGAYPEDSPKRKGRR